MYQKNFSAWPEWLPHDLPLPQHSVYSNLERAVTKHPDKDAILFYETRIDYRELHQQVCKLACWLDQQGVRKGDRVGIFAQNSPQYVMVYYAILRMGAVAVPMNPMYVADELEFLIDNAGIQVMFAALELHQQFVPLMERRGIQVMGLRYADYLREETELTIPELILDQGAPDSLQQQANFTPWQALEAFNSEQAPLQETGMEELAMLPYTSGSTGNPKGCMHSNRNVQHGIQSVVQWFGLREDDVLLLIAPMFHVVGLQSGMNATIERGATMIILPRWDRQVAAYTIHSCGVTAWPAVPAMAIDLINLPDLDFYDISSLRLMYGGGSTLPEAVAEKLHKLCGVTFIEGFGMTETCCPTSANPLQAPKAQCGGLPVFNTDVRIVDPDTLKDVAAGEVGEVVISGPQVMQGYWQSANDSNGNINENAFINLDGERYLRSGDLGYLDDMGYLFIVDRLKRMINASGYKVWPTQVEAVLYRHPAIEEVCVIALQDEKRGETVRALVVPSADYPDIDADQIIDWSRQHMAAYKIPRTIRFVEALPKSGSGKVLWRQIQEAENS